MRRKRILLVLVLAILSGAIAGFAALRLLQERPVSLIASEAPRISVPFVVATRDLEVGTILEARTPAGDFLLPCSKCPVVLVSAGVGVTPMASLLHDLGGSLLVRCQLLDQHKALSLVLP